MTKIHTNWYLYWFGCVALGILLGFGYSKFSRPTTKPNTDYLPLTSRSPAPVPETQSEFKPVTLIFTGDVMLGRSVNKNIVVHNDPTWPFKKVADVLSGADITYINLENPLVKNCPVIETGFKFCGNLENAKGLQYAGVDIASLANNHTTNYGPEGLTSTIEALELYGISPVGLGSPVRIVGQGQTFTFLSLNDIGPYPGIDNVDPDTLSDKVTRAKVKGEVLIVTFHWGHEYQSTPSARQVMLAHQVVDAGADLVIGAHPHWVQTKEIYRDVPIYYSLGNFVFDQEWSLETKRGLAVRTTYYGDRLYPIEELPVLIENYGQPRWQ